ncbi:MAG TPA: endonuclease/exonuclease/phosphatase family protein [Nocardioidaceae bacterium]|nr:endonuclease/exonuclease/phosphatase family protein [Nocardioidaceae bacterium]
MRVATFNILHGRSPVDDRVDVDRFAKAVHELDADVLGLQEVDRNQPRSANADLTAVAADAMGADEHRFVAALSGSPGATWIGATGEEQPDSAAYGIAFLSRYPVLSWEVIRLQGFPTKFPMKFKSTRMPVMVRDEPRVAVAAVVDTPHGEITVVNTHLSFITWWNARQLRMLMKALSDRSRPVLLLGDLNMAPDRAHAITGMRPLATAPTFPAHEPREQIDHVLAAGSIPDPVHAQAHPLALSDHQALSVDFA